MILDVTGRAGSENRLCRLMSKVAQHESINLMNGEIGRRPTPTSVVCPYLITVWYEMG